MSRVARKLLVSGVLLAGLFACSGTDRGRDDEDVDSPRDASIAKPDGGAADGGSCADGLTQCGSACVNLASDRSHCGECGHECSASEECSNRECKTSLCPQSCGSGFYCDSALKECRPGCDADFQCPQPGLCNTSQHTCSCNAGTHLCNDRCASNVSPESCGESCSPCPAPTNGSATCGDDTCGMACDSGFHVCGSECVSSFSTNSCGSSCTPCTAPWNGSATCDGNACGIQCSTGTHQCGKNCDSNTSTSSCGSSCSPCPTPTNGYATCDGSKCGIVCSSGYAACNGQCVAESASQCGASCQSCTSAPANGTADCMEGACSFRCSAPYLKAGTSCTTATAVTGEYADTCVITASGGVRCFNDASVGLTSNVSVITSGESHTCALVKGAVKCWGNNGDGQLGNGTTSASESAVSVLFPAGTTITQVSAGANHTCAVSTANQLFCWGSNSDGQFGNNTKTGSSSPVQISATGIAAVAAGETFTCAVTTAGAVQCTGYNYWGVLGQGANNTTDSKTFLTVSGVSNPTSIRAGDNHVCVITTSGGMKCWGANQRFQSNPAGYCGTRFNDFCGVPGDVSGYTSGVAEVSLGLQLTCVRKTNGDVSCWGYNADGQVGNGTTGQNGSSGSALVSGAISIGAALGGYHVCAVLSNGGVKCWGDNYYGQLGDGTNKARYTPVDATAP